MMKQEPLKKTPATCPPGGDLQQSPGSSTPKEHSCQAKGDGEGERKTVAEKEPGERSPNSSSRWRRPSSDRRQPVGREVRSLRLRERAGKAPLCEKRAEQMERRPVQTRREGRWTGRKELVRLTPPLKPDPTARTR
ncbi:hypothetical protein NDU88_004941 [Pleurodeles waltl]|uniref:Uncharacterized protein n=1 Tax=Pleurodeles waltl TaxID=8319 RepID=A0AAV7LK43_PLEWA|nr:hypothetical protein NDU88_004941 [Pleurodeles waltl]